MIIFTAQQHLYAVQMANMLRASKAPAVVKNANQVMHVLLYHFNAEINVQLQLGSIGILTSVGVSSWKSELNGGNLIYIIQLH